jgi:SAM-dependent methyltransferase
MPTSHADSSELKGINPADSQQQPTVRGASLPRRTCWRIARALGGRAERWAWDDQYRRGRWDNVLARRDPVTVSMVERLARNGSIVELGCGFGALVAAIQPDTYGSYVGYDISDVAVRRAQQIVNGRGLKSCHFVAGDMASWSGGHDLSLIVIEEALMYLTIQQQRGLLERCLASLRPDGCILVTAHSADKHRATIDVCHDTCSVLEEVKGGRIHLVLGPRRPLA